MDSADIIIDARGHQCPVPTLKLRKALQAAADGARLRLLADDPMAVVDVPLFVKQAGYQLETSTKIDSTITFLVVKAAAPLV